MPPPRIDAHHHLWDPARRAQPWQDGPWADPIARAFTPADLRPLLRDRGIEATVLVQSSSSYAETLDLLATAAGDGADVIVAVVGWADLTGPDLPAVLARLRAAPGGHLLAGLRHQVQDEPDPDWLARPDVRRSLACLPAAGLGYDLLITPRELPAALATVTALPEVAFVVDHAAKPPIAAGGWQPWADGLAALAARPNTVCKLSGLVTEADWRRWRPAELLHYARHVLDAFGPDRVLFGSDWPVCTLAASYAEVTEVAERAVAHLDPAGRAAVFGGTAARVYRIPR